MSWLSLVISILKEHSVCRMGCNDWKLIFYNTEIEVSTSKPVEMKLPSLQFHYKFKFGFMEGRAERIASSGSSGRVNEVGGEKHEIYAPIFFTTDFYKAGGGAAPPPESATDSAVLQ